MILADPHHAGKSRLVVMKLVTILYKTIGYLIQDKQIKGISVYGYNNAVMSKDIGQNHLTVENREEHQ